MASAYAQIEAAMKPYFDGFYGSRIETLQRVFHPNCHLYSATLESWRMMTRGRVYARVAARKRLPGVTKDAQTDNFHRGFSDDVTALAIVQIGIGDKLYTDFLNFTSS
ncbi:MAG: nuclear transport factor 2 family protein [Gammaproteobacteria bacterium]